MLFFFFLLGSCHDRLPTSVRMNSSGYEQKMQCPLCTYCRTWIKPLIIFSLPVLNIHIGRIFISLAADLNVTFSSWYQLFCFVREHIKPIAIRALLLALQVIKYQIWGQRNDTMLDKDCLKPDALYRIIINIDIICKILSSHWFCKRSTTLPGHVRTFLNLDYIAPLMH